MEEKDRDQVSNPSRLELFSRAKAKMVNTNTVNYSSRSYTKREYSEEEVVGIINSNNLKELRVLSRHQFSINGYYKQIILHYANFLQYRGVLIPSVKNGKIKDNKKLESKYNDALNFIDRLQIPTQFSDITQRILVDGGYYGVEVGGTKDSFQLLDLPLGYAFSTYKDLDGNDIIDFDLNYFNTLLVTFDREKILKAYPKFIQDAYRSYKNGRRQSSILQITAAQGGVCFQLHDGRPPFINSILASIKYEDAVEIERTRANEDVQKILVQKIPHLNDGTLLFEPDEAAEMHAGAVGMMKGNPNVRVLTTYGDVDSISSKTSGERAEGILTKIEQNIFSQAGTSGEVFNSSKSSSIKQSLQNDLSFVMYLANRYSFYITNLINSYFKTGSISFNYTLLPISHYNAGDYLEQSFKLLGSGFSAILPALALGLNQKELVGIKNLENELLNLKDKLIPLNTSYTKSGDSSSGRPGLEDEDKQDTTIAKDESLDGGNE